jgi:hypothetical protein
VILAEAIEGGCGLKGHAYTNAELVSAARAEMAKLKGRNQATGVKNE